MRKTVVQNFEEREIHDPEVRGQNEVQVIRGFLEHLELRASREQTYVKSLTILPTTKVNVVRKLFRALVSFSRLEDVNCAGVALDQFPQSILSMKHLQGLTLRSCSLNRVPEGIVDHPSLVYLGLSNNQISHFPFSKLGRSKLKLIELSNNVLNPLPNRPLNFSSGTLWVDDNGITKIPEKFFHPDLGGEINLNGNDLKKLPSSIGKLSHKCALSLARNNISTFPKRFTTTETTSGPRQLWLSHNQIRKIPESFSQLGSLKWLSLANNLLQSIPRVLSKLPQLEELSLNNNPLKSETLPSWMQKMKNLEVLYYRNNNLSAIPDWILHLSNLRELDLQGNRISEVPQSVGKLEKLSRLTLANNAIETLPSTIGNLERLEELDLKSNPIKTVPASIVKTGEGLRLYLSSSSPSLFPDRYRGSITSIRKYFQKLRSWSPEEIVQKIQRNKPLSEFDKHNHELGKYLNHILDKVANVDNPVKRDFEKFVRHKFSAPTSSSGAQILL